MKCSLKFLMLLVAVIAAALVGAERIARLMFARQERLAIAALHADQAESSTRLIKVTDDRDHKDRLARWSRYHQAMERKYRNAAAKPWMDLPPDPLPPPIPAMPIPMPLR